jgi:threonine/homoserine/homoserine lactone efflux protein
MFFMVKTFFDFLPFAVGIAISPVPIITVILSLFSARARWNGPAFLLGWALGIAVVCIPVILLTNISKVPTDSPPSTFSSIVRILLGAVLLFSSLKQWSKRPKKGEAGSIPKWLLMIDSVSPIKVLGVGFFFADLTNPKNTALTIAGTLAIAHSGLPSPVNAAMVIIFILISSLGVAIPVIFHQAGGVLANKTLDNWKKWLIANNNAVMAILFLVFGVVLISKGIQGLAGLK